MAAMELARCEAEDCMSATVITSSDSRILYVNDAWTRLCGFTEAEACGQTLAILQGQGTDLEHAAAFSQKVWSERSAETVLLNYTKDGVPFRHHLNSRKVSDPVTKEFFFVTQSYAEQHETCHNAASSPSMTASPARLGHA